ncbi:prepilin-type N-terminal cleavage/methylation domain-containing protein [Allorhodopirellula solitaria]|uniref:Pseudopilin GspJ n=1 Tax=Allorhodopirellula solitaria TaxID=2527987 RepID=A0A5C5YFU5_9BACT|nr:prepilin-type N-terminal cleavage/methylation domain-containing protein [Allorhodopirellula solitaria]TWT74170.1 hypothetical protein CA85_10570 [Allorhodopirellula solitaria]
MSHHLNPCRHLTRTRSRSAFTLVEMLIAMAITLLMMAAVARAFAFVGERVRDSRGNVSLSSELRDVTTRLNDELRRCTVPLDPVDGDDPEPNGYFEYYEGPMTDATTTILGRYSTIDDQTVAQDSRFGDLDDYLAFTAIAPPGAWFTGQVPAYILNTALDPASGSATEIAANTPVVIRSRYAEIVYFANPERDTTGAIVDADDDSIPDRVMLYRRVLLIRPDLNSVTSGVGLRLTAGNDWLTGMGDAHQIVDLSIRRQLNADGTPNRNVNAAVVANSLDDLSQPHNRFAHVRVPWGQIVGGTSPDTSMPILALEDLEPTSLIRQGSTNNLSPTLSATNNAPVVTPQKWSGYLRREFVLSGDRRGEDVIANNCRALDLQIFDPTAAFYLSSRDLVVGPGDAGYRQVLSGPTGALIPDGVPGGGFVDLAYPVLAGGALRGWQDLLVSNSPGAPSGQVTPNLEPGASDTLNITRMSSVFSGLDLAAASTFPANTTDQTYTDALFKSGRLVIAGSDQIRLFQPAFDTYTSAYERDGFYQERRYIGGRFRGTYWKQYNAGDASITDLAADGIDTNAPTLFPGEYGTDDPSERETSAPFVQTPQAIRVTVRLENVGTRQLQQMSVVHRDSL